MRGFCVTILLGGQLKGVFYKLGLSDCPAICGVDFDLSLQPRSELRGKRLNQKMPIRAGQASSLIVERFTSFIEQR